MWGNGNQVAIKMLYCNQNPWSLFNLQHTEDSGMQAKTVSGWYTVWSQMSYLRRTFKS